MKYQTIIIFIYLLSLLNAIVLNKNKIDNYFLII